MPCCAVAAAIIGQLMLGFGAVKRALFGGDTGAVARNDAVEWRPGAPRSPVIEGAPRWARTRRFGGRGLAVAAVVELLVLFGVVSGVAKYFGHGEPAGHTHGTASALAHE